MKITQVGDIMKAYDAISTLHKTDKLYGFELDLNKNFGRFQINS